MAAEKKVIDLNASRKAREEVSGDKIVVQLENAEYELPAEMPIGVTDELAKLADRDPENDGATPDDFNVIYGAMKMLMGEDQWNDFRARASMTDTMVLIQSVFEYYGVSMEKVFASH